MRILPHALEPRPTDISFKYSPSTGTPECICSRCGAQIEEGEMPIRVTTTNDKGKVDKNSMEYRFCELCTTGKKYFACDMDRQFASRCDKQCEECQISPPLL